VVWWLKYIGAILRYLLRDATHALQARWCSRVFFWSSTSTFNPCTTTWTQEVHVLSLMPTDFSERSRQKSVFAYISGLHPNPGGGTHGFNTIQCIPLSVLRTSRSFLSSGNVNGRRVSLIHHPASVFDLDMIQDHNLSAPTLPRQRSSRILSLTF